MDRVSPGWGRIGSAQRRDDLNSTVVKLVGRLCVGVEVMVGCVLGYPGRAYELGRRHVGLARRHEFEKGGLSADSMTTEMLCAKIKPAVTKC